MSRRHKDTPPNTNPSVGQISYKTLNRLVGETVDKAVDDVLTDYVPQVVFEGEKKKLNQGRICLGSKILADLVVERVKSTYDDSTISCVVGFKERLQNTLHKGFIEAFSGLDGLKIEESPEPAEKKGGRIRVKRLCSKFQDDELWEMYDEICRATHEAAEDIKKSLVCYFAAIFRICPDDNPEGKIEHFHRIFSKHMAIPTSRTLRAGWEFLKKSVEYLVHEQIKEQARWRRLVDFFVGEIQLRFLKLAVC